MTTSEKLIAISKIISKIIKKPDSIFMVLRDETEYKELLEKKHHKTQFPTIDIQYFLEDRKQEINHYTFLEGGSWVTDLALLKSVAARFEACEYLEIGTWRGESIANVADVKKSQCISVNLSPEQIIEKGFPEKYAHEHGCLIRDRENIKTYYADSLKFDFSSLRKKFDLIFVDGDHTYHAVKSDTQNVFKLLKDDSSIIIWHDYGFDPVTPRHSVIAAILDGLPTEEHKHLYHVSNTLCAIYTKDANVLNFIENNPYSANKTFKINIESKVFE